MTNHALGITYSTDRPSYHLRSYVLSIVETADPAEPWHKNGPTENNVAYYDGVFTSMQEVFEVIASYVNVPEFTVIRWTDKYGDQGYVLGPSSGRVVRSAGTKFDVVYRKQSGRA